MASMMTSHHYPSRRDDDDDDGGGDEDIGDGVMTLSRDIAKNVSAVFIAS